MVKMIINDLIIEDVICRYHPGEELFQIILPASKTKQLNRFFILSIDEVDEPVMNVCEVIRIKDYTHNRKVVMFVNKSCGDNQLVETVRQTY